MACNSCGKTTTHTSNYCSSCGTPTPCRQPRRSCAKPVLDICFSWLGKLVGRNTGKILLKDGECASYLSDVVSGPVRYDAQTDEAYVGTDTFPDPYGCERPEDQPAGMPVYAIDPGCRQPGDSPEREFAPLRPVESDSGIVHGHQFQCPNGKGLEQELVPVHVIPGPQVACPEPGFRRWKTRYLPKSSDNPCGPSMQHYLEDGVWMDDDEMARTGAVYDDNDEDVANDRMMFGIWVKSTCPEGGWQMRAVPMKYFKEFVLGLIPSIADPTDPVPQPDVIFKFYYLSDSQQTLEIPANAKTAQFEIWGAGGFGDGLVSQVPPFPDAARGGFGGYTSLTMAVTGGEQFAVIVGRGATSINIGQTPGAGFPGQGSADRHQHAAGGLSGIFSGAAQVVAGDMARAIAIAGGGGAGGATNQYQNMQKGGNGNAPNAGGQPTMKGIDGTNGQTTGKGAGGGGFSGGSHAGRVGLGGTGYVKPGVATTFQIQAAAANDLLPPGNTSPAYSDSMNAGKPETHGFIFVRIKF